MLFGWIGTLNPTLGMGYQVLCFGAQPEKNRFLPTGDRAYRSMQTERRTRPDKRIHQQTVSQSVCSEWQKSTNLSFKVLAYHLWFVILLMEEILHNLRLVAYLPLLNPRVFYIQTVVGKRISEPSTGNHDPYDLGKWPEFHLPKFESSDSC